MPYSILELPSIPRDRDQLKLLIATERSRMRRSKIMRWLAVLFFVLGCGILALNACSVPVAIEYQIWLPITAN